MSSQTFIKSKHTKGNKKKVIQIFCEENWLKIDLANSNLATPAQLDFIKNHPLNLNPPLFTASFKVILHKEVLIDEKHRLASQCPSDMVGELKVTEDLQITLYCRLKAYAVIAPPDFDPSEALQIRRVGFRINDRLIGGYDLSLCSCDCYLEIVSKEWEIGDRCIVKPDGKTLRVTEPGV